MSVSYVKFCPRCQTTTAVGTQVCVKCGHQFRTHFQPPVSERTIAMTSALHQRKSDDAEGGPQEREQPQTSESLQAPPQPRFRPRLLLICLVTALAIGALFGGFRLSQGHNHVASVANISEKNPGSASAATADMIIRGDSSGRPAALAAQSPLDLQRWQETAAKTSENPQASDSPAHVHLYLSGRIALISPGTTVRVLSGDGALRRVQILDGLHQGAVGYINSTDVGQPTGFSLIPAPGLPTAKQ